MSAKKTEQKSLKFDKENPIPYEDMSVRQQVIQDLINKDVRLSYSTLKKFETPITLINYLVDKRTKVFIPTEGMIYGSLCDLLLFTPDDYDTKFTVANVPTTALMIAFAGELIQLGKAEGLEMTEDLVETIYSNHYKSGTYEKTWDKLKGFVNGKIEGKDICSAQQKEEADNLIGALKKHNEVDDVLQQIVTTQKKIQWIYDGWKFIGYYDAFMEGNNIMDGKYTKDANPENFYRDIYNMKYHLQSGMYCDYLIQSEINVVPKYTFLTYDKSSNYSVINMEPSYIKYGIREYQYLTQKMSQMAKYKQFSKSYGFFKKEFTATKPNWARGFDLKGE